MNVNRNLHATDVLTEFARDFDDDEPETMFSKLVNRVTTVVNTNYNALSSYPQSRVPSSSSAEEMSPNEPEKPIEDTKSEPPSSSTTTEGKTTRQSSVEKPDVLSLESSPGGRTPLSVIKRISNLVAQKDTNLTNYKDTDLQKFWMPDAKSKECYDCSVKFTTFRRRHHCRLCGQIFCSKCCSQNVPGKIIMCSGDLKVCTYCSKIVLSYLKSPDITADLRSDLQALQEDLSNKLATNPSSAANTASDDCSVHRFRKVSVGYQEERLIASPNLTHLDRKSILQQSTSLKSLYDEMVSRLPKSNRGQDFINYLINTSKASDKGQAVVILNAIVDAGFLIPVIEEEVSLSPAEESPTFDETRTYNLVKIDVSPADREPSSPISIAHSAASPSFDTLPPPTPDSSLYNVVKDFEKQDTLFSTVASKPLLESFCDHEDQLIHQLLQKNNLHESWAKILVPICARVANTIKPEVCQRDRVDTMDIRNFVNFKKIPVGDRNQSRIIGGAVFSKNVTHKNMPTEIESPRVLLLSCAILYQRDENKFVTLDNLLLQEHEYLSKVTMRIRSLKPNIVLVHKSVAGVAQDMLMKGGITLVLDVKMTILERLARCLQCDIISSIDSNIWRPKLGVCDKFYRKNYTDAMGQSKTLMFFEKRFNPLGCCILLKGAPIRELNKVKKIASIMLFARYNWLHEMAFLLDEFARPASPKPQLFDSPNTSPEKTVEAVDNQPRVDGDTDDKKKEKSDEATKVQKIQMETLDDFSDPLRGDAPVAVDDNRRPSMKLAVQRAYDNKFRDALNATMLSISPSMSFPLPYLETEQGRKCILRELFPEELFFSKQWSSTPLREAVVELCDGDDEEKLNPVHEYITHQVTEPFNTKNEQNLLADYRSKGCRYAKTFKIKLLPKKMTDKVASHPHRPIEEYVYKDALDLDNHQRLPVLFYSYYNNPKAPCFCAPPNLLEMHFYGQNDIMLGLFLERYCLRSSYFCPSCNLPMTDHVRRYVHSMGCVQVKLREDAKRMETNNTIMMTSWCSICNEWTPNVPMSKDAWCLSFAKYLELRFHAHSYKRNYITDLGGSSKEIEATASVEKVCRHSLHRDYIQLFSRNGLVASITYEPIEAWEISLPPLFIKLKHLREFDKMQVLEDVKSFAMKGYEVYANVHDQIADISPEMADPKLTNLKLILNQDQLNFKLCVEKVQTLLTEKVLNTYEINDAMLMVKRTLCESIEAWNPRLQEAALQAKLAAAKTEGNVIDNAAICTEEGPNDAIGSPDSKSVKSCDDDDQSIDAALEDVAGASEQSFRSKLNSSDSRAAAEIQTKDDKKTIKQLLAQLLSSGGNVNLVQSPVPTNEHLTLPLGSFPILVHDQDLSSVIAYTLISHEYKKGLELLNSTYHSDKSPNSRRKSESTGDTDDKEPKEKDSKDKTDGEKLKKSLDFTFQDTTTTFSCKVYFAREFDVLRMNFLASPFSTTTRCTQMDDIQLSTNPGASGDNTTKKPNDLKDSPLTEKCDEVRKAFARSLCRSVEWKARGGKSGSRFSKTIDDQFVIKEMSKTDVGIFENFAPHYFEYINQCLMQGKPTLLAKIFGVFKVTIKKKDSLFEKSILVMEHLFADREISNKYDLKGSERNRLVDPTNQTGEIVLLDENLVQMSWSKPLYILTHSNTILKEAINRDSSFLEKNSVMDYSLLVGLDNKNNQLVLGIIDYIRTYTLDKKIESLVKSTGLLGGQGKLPTVISPRHYKQRFAESMEKYFFAVPDRWEGLSKK